MQATNSPFRDTRSGVDAQPNRRPAGGFRKPGRVPGRRLTLLGPLALLAGLAGCGGGGRPEPLQVAAASDLRQALPVLIAAYRQGHPGEVEFTAGSSGQLAEQIRQGASFDLFLSANREFVAKLATDGTVEPASVRPYALGKLVVAINPVFAHHPKTLEDLANPAIRSIAIANPELAPYGIAAKQALERRGLYDRLRAKLVPAESVHQALQFVRSGSAEVGFVSRALTGAPGLDLMDVPGDAHDPIVQNLGVVARSKRRDEARAFADFLTGPTGQAMLRDLGFGPASAAPPAAPPTPAAR